MAVVDVKGGKGKGEMISCGNDDYGCGIGACFKSEAGGSPWGGGWGGGS